VRADEEADNARTIVPDGHVKRRTIALAACVHVTAVTNQPTHHFYRSDAKNVILKRLKTLKTRRNKKRVKALFKTFIGCQCKIT